MSNSQANRKKLVLSPKTLIRKLSNKNSAVQSEYQLKFAKQTSKKQEKKLPIDEEMNVSQRNRSDSKIRRRLSFKKQIAPNLVVEMPIPPKKDNTNQSQQQRRIELARAIEYSSQGNYSKQNRKTRLVQTSGGATAETYRRIRRIKSNDSFLINRNANQQNREIDQTLLALRKENDLLKQMHFKSLKDLSDLQTQYAEQKSTFDKEEKYYQKKIQVLRRQIQSNRLQIGHLFSYKDFDANKWSIRPIVEVEGESSIVRSILSSSGFSQLHQISKLMPIYSNEYKEEMTQATGPTSRQSCRDIDLL